MERRLAAILSADVVGYSRLMESDDAGTLSALKAHRQEAIDPAIADHHGRIIKLMGDGALVEFASVVDAVNCAAVIQRRMADRNAEVPENQRIAFRIGVHLGDIMVDADDIYGDGVNVAARLEQLTAPGRVSLSEDAYRQVRGKTEFDFEDLGQKQLKNLSASMRVYMIADRPGAAPPSRPWGRPTLRRWTSVAILAVLVVVGAAFAIQRFSLLGPIAGEGGSELLPAMGLPIVEVRPFSDTSTTPERPYLAKGLTQEFVAALGRFNTLWVVGPSVERGQDSQPRPRSDYLFEGSVQQSGSRVRIIARLTDAKAGTVRWSERYVGLIDDLFEFEEQTAHTIAGALATNVVQLEGRKRATEDAPNASAFDLILQARAIGYSANRAANRRFRALIEQAIVRDPDYSVAHGMLAEALTERAVLGWSQFPDRDLSRAEEIARRAIELAPDQPDGHRALGNVLSVRGDYEQAQSSLAQALRINPSDPRALATWGAVQSYMGEIELAVSALERALNYNPHMEADQFFDLAAAYYLARRHRDALRAAEQGLSQYPDFAMLRVAAAAAAAQLGETQRADRHADEVRRLLPYFSPSDFGSRFRLVEQRRYFREGLKLAGL